MSMNIQKLLSEMTLEEKAALCQGADFWHLVAIPRLNIPAAMVSDGPHGLRKQDQEGDHLGINDSIQAVCLPAGCATASSFDRDTAERLGETLGEAAQAEDLAVVLGPAANIKRSPLCGRNFEYYSEDPYLSGEIAAAYIRGVQSRGVGTSLKHFAANNQETRRMSVSERISMRALREIYLASFEGAVKGGKPWTLMCSYNKINGVYSSENEWLLTQVLRDEWGFDGLVMTDWGACNDHAAGVAAGLDLEMPRSGDDDDLLLVKAVREGKVSMEALDQAAARVLQLIDRWQQGKHPAVFDRKAQHDVARKLAAESMVLLKNEGALLPLKKEQKVAFIGWFAEHPRFQGGGSSHINCSEVTSALSAAAAYSDRITYAQGFGVREDKTDPALLEEAVSVAKNADVAVLFLGLPEYIESEGYDRKDLDLPACQTALLEAVAAVQPRLAVVLHNGAPVTMPWAGKARAILETYLGGQAGGGAAADLLYGAANPCGKLAETFPLRLEDTPCYLDFPGDGDSVNYSEDIWVGYRYYDRKNLPVLFPFGHGLSYTTFAYSNLRLSADRFDGGELTVSVDVTNTGSAAGKEAVQFYVRPMTNGKLRPVRELKGFGRTELAPGETKTVTAVLNERSFSYWEESIGDWYMEPGAYLVEAAASSRDIRLSTQVQVSNAPLKIHVTMDTTFSDVQRIPGYREALGPLAAILDAMKSMGDDGLGEGGSAMGEAMAAFMPLHAFASFSGGRLKRGDIQKVVDQLNQIQKI